MKSSISKTRLQARLHALLMECQQAETAAFAAGHWDHQCLEAYEVWSVQFALTALQIRNCEQFRAWCGEPHYTIDYAILACLDP